MAYKLSSNAQDKKLGIVTVQHWSNVQKPTSAQLASIHGDIRLHFGRKLVTGHCKMFKLATY
jgi:hypothetical protein